jgi:hypothetical protein
MTISRRSVSDQTLPDIPEQTLPFALNTSETNSIGMEVHFSDEPTVMAALESGLMRFKRS